MKNKVYINNYSLNCSLGLGKVEVSRGLFEKSSLPSEVSYELVDGKKTPLLKVKEESLPTMPEEFSLFNSRNNRLILSVLEDLKEDIHFFVSKYGADRVGVVFGTSTSGIAEGIEALRASKALKGSALPADYNYSLQEIGSPSLFIQNYLKLSSISYTISTACSSSARTFIEAQSLIRNNICDVVLVGGSDSLNDLTPNGFHSLEAISMERTNPMSKNRNGINIGEGSSLFILSRDESSLELLGCGESSDAFHISSPDPSGSGAIRAMFSALDDAKLSAGEIDYINLHGTGTPKNDEMESKAISKVFKGSKIPYASSTKPYVGHTLGAAGGIEIAICALVLGDLNPENRLPIHQWDGSIDSELPQLNLVSSGTRYNAGRCMSNSYAFGGNNASVIIGRNSCE